MAWTTILSSIGIGLLSGLAYLANTVYQHRSKINQLRKQGIPMPKEWSWLTGHLLVLQKYVDKIPPDANVNLAMADLCKEYADTEVFLMDFWPVYPPLLMVYSPDTAVQISTKYNLPKTSMHLKMMKPVAGGPNLISMSGKEWKVWRSLFNPGFSAGSMMENVPHIVDYVNVFCERLREKVEGKEMFCLDDLTTRLTMDIIIKVTLDADLDYQRKENPLATALGYITRWHSFWDPRILMHPARPFIQKYNSHVMNTYIRKELDQRFTELREEKMTTEKSTPTGRGKSVITLALEAYIASNQDRDISTMTKLDSHFAQYATYQIRLFLFAGNDTTSSSIVYTYHMLSKHPSALATLRTEHDAIFGSNPSAASALLKQNPALLNQCPYTLAVIKETLRLFSPAATMRSGQPGIVVTDQLNNSYPMDHVGATIVHQAVHLNPRIWPRATEFLPERFLVSPDHPLYPNPAAYRPFEQGPRNCIGQTLVYNEMRIVLVLTARLFDIRPVYDEFDARNAAEESWVKRGLKSVGVLKEPLKTVNGERAYQTEKAGTHPADGYPCRVEMADWTGARA
ncbi:cytochrome P450 [Lindgomyces ingoldianus]|uniref:Cytochrome P450 n=1 Tax=Lindgomyces ingoldianus TaxID=673940 RepID=A0ACB6RB32_9PLEO|nr:cytochrome P450 [Lindgomyces ingoldianus]KAF2475930.1 cytochrome P450 [Lindgomyces ingoldianus]